MMTNQTQGWHPADVKAALEKRGWNLYKLSRHMGHKNVTSASSVWKKNWPVLQKLIGEIIETNPAEIWPDRYNADGTPKGAIRRKYRKIQHVGNRKESVVA